MREFLLYGGPVLNIISVLPYIIDVIRRKTKPNIVSWITWTILTAIGTAAIIAEAGLISSLLPLSACICTLSVVLLGTKYGFAKYSKLDMICQASAFGGLLLWLIFSSPVIALIAVIVIDAIAAIPTFVHAWKMPAEETWQTFAIGSFAALLTILAFEKYTFAGSSYPIYLTIANGMIASTVVYRRLQKGISLSRKSIHKTLHENI